MRLEAIYADGDRHFVTLRLILNGCTNDYWLRFFGGDSQMGSLRALTFVTFTAITLATALAPSAAFAGTGGGSGETAPDDGGTGGGSGTTAPDGGGTGGGSGETEK